MIDESSQEVDGIAEALKLSNEERLNKIIARAGVASRRGAENLVRIIISYTCLNLNSLLFHADFGWASNCKWENRDGTWR